MRTRKKDIIPTITPETTLENARRWLNIIRYGESGTVIQLQDDCEYRVLQIIEDPKLVRSILGPYYKKYLLKYFPLDEKDLHKSIKESLLELCHQRRIATTGILSRFTNSEILSEIANRGYDIGLFISHITPLFYKHTYQPLLDLELLIRTSKNLSVIIFSELDITHDKYNLLVDKASFLFDHIIKYPLYSKSDSRQFIRYYNYYWDFTLPEKTTDEIIEACGGYLWLLHQAQRNLRDNPQMTVEEAASNEIMVKKLETIWTKFTETEKSILRKIHFENLLKLDTLSHEYEYLKTVRMIIEKNGKPVLGIPILSLVIERENRLNKLKIQVDRVFIGEKDITTYLARQERVLMLLLLNTKRKIIPRDKVAQAVWGKDWEDKYSDWALDRLVHRIRKKLRTLGVDERLLKTVKRKGLVIG